MKNNDPARNSNSKKRKADKSHGSSKESKRRKHHQPNDSFANPTPSIASPKESEELFVGQHKEKSKHGKKSKREKRQVSDIGSTGLTKPSSSLGEPAEPTPPVQNGRVKRVTSEKEKRRLDELLAPYLDGDGQVYDRPFTRRSRNSRPNRWYMSGGLGPNPAQSVTRTPGGSSSSDSPSEDSSDDTGGEPDSGSDSGSDSDDSRAGDSNDGPGPSGGHTSRESDKKHHKGKKRAGESQDCQKSTSVGKSISLSDGHSSLLNGQHKYNSLSSKPTASTPPTLYTKQSQRQSSNSHTPIPVMGPQPPKYTDRVIPRTAPTLYDTKGTNNHSSANSTKAKVKSADTKPSSSGSPLGQRLRETPIPVPRP
ncbi:hypothetical protein M426DRAFT_8598 [Hypoxylon sp. CI-4A]|nr:hypothetical protein M426DRAFT_8598 [Hypoxylon sp. CI-4A]